MKGAQNPLYPILLAARVVVVLWLGAAACPRLEAQFLAPPAITQQPASVTNFCSTNCATFTVAATGTAPLHYQWYWNNSAVPFANNTNYTVCNVTPSQAGSYFCRVTNSIGVTNSATANLVVITVNIAPQITCRSNVTAWTCSTQLSVTYASPAVTDNLDPRPSVTCTPPSGFVFSAGTTPVLCSAVDKCGNSNSCSFTVTVLRDTNGPALNCLSNIFIQCGTPWNFLAPTAFDDYSGTNVSLQVAQTITNHLCGNTYSAARTWVAYDACSNASFCTQTIRVGDTIPPVVNCPSNRTVVANSTNGAVATFAASATDICDPSPTVVCSPPSGSVFPLGNNLVTCVATDACGNSNACFFTVTVVMMPRLVSAFSMDALRIGCAFDMPLDQASAENVANWSLVNSSTTNPVPIASARLWDDGTSVELSPGPCVSGERYTLSAAGVVWAGGSGVPGPTPSNGTIPLVPGNWVLSDVGSLSPAGKLFSSASNYWEIRSTATALFTGAVDRCSFAYQKLSGDFDLAARVGIIVNYRPVGGLMLRSASDPTSASASLLFDSARNNAVWITRTNDGGQAQFQAEVTMNPDGNYFRLRRVGDTTTAFTSLNGTDWSVVGIVVVDHKPSLLVGLAVGTTQAGQDAGFIVNYFKMRSYQLQPQHMPTGMKFSWFGPGDLQEATLLTGGGNWRTSPLTVSPSGDQRWVIYTFNPQPDPPADPTRFFRVLVSPNSGP